MHVCARLSVCVIWPSQLLPLIGVPACELQQPSQFVSFLVFPAQQPSHFFFACCSCWTAFYYTHCETSEKTPEINKKLHKKLSDTTVNYFCGLWPPVSGSSSGSSGHFVSQPSFSCFCWGRASTGDLRLSFHLRERSPVRTGWSSPLLRCRHLRLFLRGRSLVANIAWSSPMQRCWLQWAGLGPVCANTHAFV